jgi:hypothetical protein
MHSSTFQRFPARARDVVAFELNRRPANFERFTLHCCEPIADKAGHYCGRESMSENGPVGDTA